MELFQQTFSMFKPFVPPRGGATATESEKVPEPKPDEDNIDDLRRQMKDMPRREGDVFLLGTAITVL